MRTNQTLLEVEECNSKHFTQKILKQNYLIRFNPLAKPFTTTSLKLSQPIFDKQQQHILNAKNDTEMT